MTFRAKWAVGSLLCGGLIMAVVASHSLPLLAVSGAAISAFGVALSTDYGGLATRLRQAQAAWLDVSPRSFRLIGGVATLIGLLWIALALAKLGI